GLASFVKRNGTPSARARPSSARSSPQENEQEGRKVFDLIPFRPSVLPVNSLCGALRAGLGPLSLSPSPRTPLPQACTIAWGRGGGPAEPETAPACGACARCGRSALRGARPRLRGVRRPLPFDGLRRELPSGR